MNKLLRCASLVGIDSEVWWHQMLVKSISVRRKETLRLAVKSFDLQRYDMMKQEREREAERFEIIWGMCKAAGGPPLFQTFYTAVISDG